MEAALVALDSACTEAKWLKILLNNIPILIKHVLPISIHYDSQVAIAKAKSKNYNEKRKHLVVRHKTIRHMVSHGIIFLDFVKSENNIANPLTKALTRQQVLKPQREWD